MKLDFDNLRRTGVLLDPHPLCHAALTSLLAQSNIEVVGAATSPAAAAALLDEHRPDLLMTEVDLPEGRDAALRVISDGRRDNPALTAIVLSSTNERDLIDAAFEHGASAYVLKTSDPAEVTTAVRQAFEPSLYLAPPRAHDVPTAPVTRNSLRKLTRRELEILRLVSEGRSNRQVAEILWVTDQTVKFHLANVYRKLGVRSRFEAARWAQENGMLQVEEATEAAAIQNTGSIHTNGATALVSLRQRRRSTDPIAGTSR